MKAGDKVMCGGKKGTIHSIDNEGVIFVITDESAEHYGWAQAEFLRCRESGLEVIEEFPSAEEIVRNYQIGYKEKGDSLWWMMMDAEYDKMARLWDCYVILGHAFDLTTDTNRVVKALEDLLG